MSVAEYFSSMDYGPAPEDDQAARAWLAQHDAQLRPFHRRRVACAGVGRDLRRRASRRRAKLLAQIAQGDAADVDAAVAAARAAQPGWHGAGRRGRARHLYALARMVQRHSRLFAVLEALDNGKPIRETRDIDMPLVARHFLHHAGWAQLQDSEFAGLTRRLA